VPIGQEAVCAPESVWTLRRREQSYNAGNRTRAVQPVAIPTELSRLPNKKCSILFECEHGRTVAYTTKAYECEVGDIGGHGIGHLWPVTTESIKIARPISLSNELCVVFPDRFNV
jgi:hypothetical protein